MPPLAPGFGSVPGCININFEAPWCITNIRSSQTSSFQPFFFFFLYYLRPSPLHCSPSERHRSLDWKVMRLLIRDSLKDSYPDWVLSLSQSLFQACSARLILVYTDSYKKLTSPARGGEGEVSLSKQPDYSWGGQSRFILRRTLFGLLCNPMISP